MSGFRFISRGCATSFVSVLLLGIGSGISTFAQSNSAPKVTVSGSDLEFSPPKLVHWGAAELGDEGRAAHYRGVCVVSMVVNREGRPEDVHVIRSLGMGLDANAIKAAKKFRFIPAMNNHGPISVKVTVEVPFKGERWQHTANPAKP